MRNYQTFLVFRQKKEDSEPYYERFNVPNTPKMSVLDALFYIQDWEDSHLSFRYSCRGAICGSCGMTIDKVPLLACRTQVSTVKSSKKPVKLPEFKFGDHADWDSESEILIEPLPNMTVLKDLIVDMEPFWKFYREVEPFFTRNWNDSAPESSQSPNQMKTIERLVYCILCGLCWACPVSKENRNYLGPAQLAKADRFIRDSRITDVRQKSILSRVLKDDAVPACEKYFVCNRVCPKGVMPGTAIKDIRDNWVSEK